MSLMIISFWFKTTQWNNYTFFHGCRKYTCTADFCFWSDWEVSYLLRFSSCCIRFLLCISTYYKFNNKICKPLSRYDRYYPQLYMYIVASVVELMSTNYKTFYVVKSVTSEKRKCNFIIIYLFKTLLYFVSKQNIRVVHKIMCYSSLRSFIKFADKN